MFFCQEELDRKAKRESCASALAARVLCIAFDGGENLPSSSSHLLLSFVRFNTILTTFYPKVSSTSITCASRKTILQPGGNVNPLWRLLHIAEFRFINILNWYLHFLLYFFLSPRGIHPFGSYLGFDHAGEYLPPFLFISGQKSAAKASSRI